MKKNTPIGLLFAITGVIGAFFSISTINEDKNDWIFGYTYEPPLTNHEIAIIFLLVASILAIIVGLVIISKSQQSNPSADKAKYVDNANNPSDVKDLPEGKGRLYPSGGAKVSENLSVASGRWKCPECDTVIANNLKFCPACGKKKIEQEEETWSCAECGKSVSNNFLFCPYCGTPKKQEPQPWICPTCKKEHEPDLNFCPYCGHKKP